MDIKQVEKKIRTACVRVQNAGGKIRPSTFGSKGRSLKEASCCPITACVPIRGEGVGYPITKRASLVLGIEEYQIWEFVYGFDGPNQTNPSEIRKLGQVLRQELNETGNIKPYKETT